MLHRGYVSKFVSHAIAGPVLCNLAMTEMHTTLAHNASCRVHEAFAWVEQAQSHGRNLSAATWQACHTLRVQMAHTVKQPIPLITADGKQEVEPQHT